MSDDKQIKKSTPHITNGGEKDTLSKIQALPKTVRDFILSESATETSIKIIKDFKLTPAQEDLFFDITDKVIFKELKLEDFPAEVEKKFGFDKEKSKKLALEILGNVFLPMDSYLGDVSAVIKKLGGDPNKFAVEHIALEKISIENLVEEILKEANVSAKEGGLKRRLKNIITSRFNEARGDEETIAVMMRGTKVGGLGMDKKMANKVMQIIRAKIGEFQLVDTEANHSAVKPKPVAYTLPKVPDNLPTRGLSSSSEERSRGGTDIKKTTPLTSTAVGELPYTPQSLRDSSPQQRGANEGSKSPKPEIIFDFEDEREIEYQKKQIEKKKIIDEAINLDKEVEKSIQNILKKGKFSFTDENLKQKFLNVVSARLRDVRDKNETLDILMRDRSSGGLGLKDTDARKVLNLIEIEFSALNKLRKKVELQKLEDWKKIKEEEKKQKTEREEKKEEGELEKRWTKLTGKPARFSAPAIAKESASKPISAPPKISSKLPKLTEPPKSVSAPVEARSPKPKIEGIKFTPRLTGPIDELRQMTLVDFRRLAPNPKQAIEKIKDKIELLEDESYTKKIEGIKAWKKSEPSRVYFEILNKSLTEMTPIADILKERADKNLRTLGQEEFNALVELSKELRV